MDEKKEKEKVLRILEAAIRSEIDGYNFYLWASIKTKDPRGKALFKDLAVEEIRHLKILEVEYANCGGIKAWREPGHEDLSKGKTFEIGPGIRIRIDEGTTEKEALKIALAVEKDAESFYRHQGENAKDRDVRKMFLGLADMEKRHLEMIRYQYETYTLSGD